MVCLNGCGKEIPRRPKGRGRHRSHYCSDECREELKARARARALAAEKKRHLRAFRPRKKRVPLWELMEREAIGAGYPGMYAHPGAVWRSLARQPLRPTRNALGAVALELGLLLADIPEIGEAHAIEPPRRTTTQDRLSPSIGIIAGGGG